MDLMFQVMGDTGMVVEGIIALQSAGCEPTLPAIAKFTGLSKFRAKKALRVVEKTGTVYHIRTSDKKAVKWGIRNDNVGECLKHAIYTFHANMALHRLVEERCGDGGDA